MSDYTTQLQQNLAPHTLRGPSPAIWSRQKWIHTLDDPGEGFQHHDDFVNGPVLASGEKQSGYHAFIDGAGTIKQIVEEGGVLELATPAGAEDEVYLQGSGGSGAWAHITSGASARRLWWEARLKASAIVAQSLFIGLSEEGLAVAGTLADATGVLADKDLVGFQVVAATPDKVDAIHRKAGSALVVVKAAAHTLVAATYVKLGVQYDTREGVVRWFVNGLQVGADVKPTAVGFPDGEKLALLAGIKTHAAVAKKLALDWWRVAQDGNAY